MSIGGGHASRDGEDDARARRFRAIFASDVGSAGGGSLWVWKTVELPPLMSAEMHLVVSGDPANIR